MEVPVVGEVGNLTRHWLQYDQHNHHNHQWACERACPGADPKKYRP